MNLIRGRLDHAIQKFKFVPSFNFCRCLVKVQRIHKNERNRAFSFQEVRMVLQSFLRIGT